MATFDDIIRLGALAERMNITREGAKVVVRCQGDDGAGALELITAIRDELLDAAKAANATRAELEAEDAAADPDGGDGSDGGEV